MKKLLFCVGATVLFSFASAQAADRPDVKEGLWSSQTQTIDNPGNKRNGGAVTICRSHAYDQYVKDLAAKMPGCKKLSEAYSGHTYTTVLHCTVANSCHRYHGEGHFQGRHRRSTQRLMPPTRHHCTG